MREELILSELFKNEGFLRKVIPYIKSDYFETSDTRWIFTAIKKYIYRYKKLPTFSAIYTLLERQDKIDEDTFKLIGDTLTAIKSIDEDNSTEFLIDQTEEFCKDRAIINAMSLGSEIIQQGGNPYEVKALLEEALKVGFDHHLGIDFFDKKSISKRHDDYNKKNNKFKTHIEKLNYLTNGGFEEKALHIFLGDTHAGKTMTLAALAAGFIRNGYDALYITLEMSEEKIARLIDANFIDIEINNIADTDKEEFVDFYRRLDTNKLGRLFIREYPTTTAGTNIFRTLLDDLRTKKEFKPQIVIVDYVNIMKCDRYNEGNSYTLVKGIVEELRGLAVEGNYCMISATQTNREGAKSSDIDMTDTAESYGLPQTADLLIGMMTSDTLREQNLLIWKSLKNRLAGILNYKFPVKTQFAYANILDCDRENEDIVNTPSNEVVDKKQAAIKKLTGLKVNNINKIRSTEKTLFE